MSKYLFREIVIDSRTGLNPRKNFKLGNGNNYYITIKDIHNGRIEISDKTDRIDDEAVAIIKKRSRIKNGDVLFTSIGRIGETAIVQDKNDTWEVNESIFIFTLNTGIIDTRYFCHLLRSDPIQERLTRDSSGSTFKSIKMNQLEKLILDIPPLSTQKQIAANLDKATQTIDLCNAILEKLDLLVKARFVERFGDPELNQKGFPMFKMSDIVVFQGGSQPDKKHFEYEPSEDNIRLIQIRDYRTDKYITYIPKSLAKRHCTADDIMIGRYGPPIFQILQGIEGSYNVALMKAVPQRGNKEFIRYFLKQECLLHYLEGMSKRTAGQDGIQMDKLKAYPFPFPPLELQNQFAAFVEKTDRTKAAVKQVLAKAETLKKALMQEYFG